MSKFAKPIDWEKVDKIAPRLSAYAVLGKDDEMVARIIVRHGPRTTAIVHFIGSSPFAGYANGGGYDKESAAVENACDKWHPGEHEPQSIVAIRAFIDLVTKGREGHFWYNRVGGTDGWRVLSVIG